LQQRSSNAGFSVVINEGEHRQSFAMLAANKQE